MRARKLILFQSNRVIFDSNDTSPAPGFILVDSVSGRIVSVNRENALVLNSDQDIEVVNFGNLLIFPGLVDSHVHVNDPGRDHWETFPNATKAALAGGTCTIGDMPLNCIPVTTTPSAFNAKIKATEDRIWSDVGFIGGLVPANVSPETLSSLLDCGVVAVKGFMCYSGIDDYPGVSLDHLDQAMPTLASHGVPLMVHAELECSNNASSQIITEDPRCYKTFLQSRPDDMEISAIKALISLAEKHGCHVHVVHLSSCEALPILQEARRRGVKLTVETCPHYLCFCSEKIDDGKTLYKCCPPIRDAANQDALWQALFDGDIDMIVSDHSPSSPDVKCIDSGDFLRAWGGIAGLQFRLLSIWTEGSARGVDFKHLCRWLCENPVKLIGMDTFKGRLRAGYDADFVVWDPEASSSVSVVHHLHKCTPYESMEFSGRIHFTYLRGQLAYSAANETFNEHNGIVLRR